jgi:hypothetical protein
VIVSIVNIIQVVLPPISVSKNIFAPSQVINDPLIYPLPLTVAPEILSQEK